MGAEVIAEQINLTDGMRPNSFFSWSKEKQQLWHLVKKEGRSVADIAKESGVSRSLLSRLLNEKGYSPSEEILEKFRAYLRMVGRWEESLEWISDVDDLEMIGTRCYHQTKFVLDSAMEGCGFGLVTGPSGCGKTTAARAWMTENPDQAIFITANRSMTMKSVVRVIAEALNLKTKGDTTTLIGRVVKELIEIPRLIIIDEADQIGRTDKLEILRTILDEAGTVGIVFLANEDLSEYILQVASEHRSLARIHNRFVVSQFVKMPTEEEGMRWLERVNLDEFSRKRLIWHLQLRDGRGGFRVVRTYLRALFKAVGTDEITKELMNSETLNSLVLSAQS
jgi:Uncharacterized ATPase, putative transposase